MKRSKVLIALSALFGLWVSGQAQADKFITFWTLSENQANIKQGGRANTIAVHPANSNQMFVASESGGLFKSTDHGLHWTHVDSLPVIFTEAVVYHPSNPAILLVTAKEDFKTNNGGGVWRSADGGVTWNQMALTIPNFAGRLSAYEISLVPRSGSVVIGTSEGIFQSFDTGLTWTYSDVFGGGNRTVLSVLATSDRIYAGGPAGVRIRLGTPPTWATPASQLGSVQDIHAFGRSPLTANAYLVNGSSRLFVTENGGANWTQITSAPVGGPPCGGISFLKVRSRTTIPNRQVLDLYFGNRCWLHRLAAPVFGNTANHGGTWQRSEIEHADTRDLAFANNEPVLLGTDGGLHNTPDGGVHWPFVGGGRLGGFNALQVTEVDAQLIRDSWTTDLYFGTQDNNVWASNIWGNIYALFGAEGFFIEAERTVQSDADAQINFTACGGCQNNESGRHFAGSTPWHNPPGFVTGSPVVIRRSTYVQGMPASVEADAGLAITLNSGIAWWQFARFNEERRDLPKLGRSGFDDPSHTTILYQAFRTNQLGPMWNQAARLLRVHRTEPTNDVGTVFFPAMNGFGALGTTRTMFVPYQVYAVDPGNPFHLIAPDVVNQKVMETRDGGENWTEIPGLANLVTNNGQLVFRMNLLGPAFGAVFPVVTAVSFSPQDPRLVLVGTMEGGIYISGDNGATWRKIAGTDPATYITSFAWQNANTVYVSTYGRGLWKLRNVRIAIPGAFDELCGACEVLSMDGGSQPPQFDGSVHVFEGTILGVRTEKSQLRELLVTPGSSVVFTGDQKDAQDDIVITESNGRDASDYEPLPQHPKGWIAKGLVFVKGDMLTGTVYGESEASLLPPPTKEDYQGSTKSPTEGTPYVHLTASAFYGVAAALPEETFELAATDFVGGASYEVLIDDVALKGEYTADDKGSFTARISAPEDQGYHRVEVRRAGDKEAIDGSVLLVMHDDHDE